jgi:hypothetical protein
MSNICLNELDRYVEDTLGPMYTRGKHRRLNSEYTRITRLLTQAKKDGDRSAITRLTAERRKIMCAEPCDADYRRLRYVRYADDFLLGFAGPANEAREIRERLSEFLEQRLQLTLSKEKTLITHAVDGKARFLGYEIKTIRQGDLISADGRRATNGRILLLMPREVAGKYLKSHSQSGKVIHRTDLLNDSDYTIIQRFQSVLVGLYNYYCMATNVSRRMSRIKLILQTSLLKTLASKHKCTMGRIIRMYRVPNQEYTTFRKVIDRPGKEPLVAEFGGMSLRKKPEGMGQNDFDPQQAWHRPSGKRSEVVQHLIW